MPEIPLPLEGCEEKAGWIEGRGIEIRDKLMSFSLLSRYFILVLIIFVVFGCIRCGRGDHQTEADTSTITILYPGDELYLGHCYNMDPRLLVFDPLISWDLNGDLEGRLAESWQHSSDYLTWTINLHKDACWHDGVPVTSHDIKFTLDLMSHPDVGWLPPNAYSITILDDKTYTITQHSGGELYNSMNDWEVYYPKHLLEHLDPKDLCDWDFWVKPVGNGPYRYVRHVPNEYVVLEANPDYYRGKPRIGRVILKFGTQVVTELLSGNVDAAVWIKRIDVHKLKGDPHFREYYDLSPWHVGIYWNQRYQKFRDPKIRRALTLAINRKELIQLINLPKDIPIVDGPFSTDQFLRGELPEPIPYDPEMARRLFDEVGWRDVDGKGVREKEGEKFSFTGIVTNDRKEEAVYVQDQFRRVGIKMEVLIIAQETLLERYRAGDFEAAFWLFASGIWRGISKFFSDDSPIGYHNPQIERLLENAMEIRDPRGKERICKELWPIFQTELPITFLYPNIESSIIHRRVRGLKSLGRASPIMDIYHLWIEEER